MTTEPQINNATSPVNRRDDDDDDEFLTADERELVERGEPIGSFGQFVRRERVKPKSLSEQINYLALEIERGEFIECHPALQGYDLQQWFCWRPYEGSQFGPVIEYQLVLEDGWPPIPPWGGDLKAQLAEAEARLNRNRADCIRRLKLRFDGRCDGGVRRYMDTRNAFYLADRDIKIIKERIRLEKLDRDMVRRVKKFSGGQQRWNDAHRSVTPI